MTAIHGLTDQTEVRTGDKRGGTDVTLFCILPGISGAASGVLLSGAQRAGLIMDVVGLAYFSLVLTGPVQASGWCRQNGQW